MRKGIILTVMFLGVLVLGFSQSTLSGTYRYSANAYITFNGSSFSGSWNSTTAISGTYAVSGTRLTLNITGGPKAPNTWAWTIVDANTLRDQDGDRWNKEGAGTGSSANVPARPPVVWTVNSPAGWIDAVNGIRNGGNNREHSIIVSGNISVIPTLESENTFGTLTGITVTMQGEGSLTTSSGDPLLRIGERQTIIARDVSFRSLVAIGKGGAFRMEGRASVSGSSVVIDNGGSFAMKDNSSVAGGRGVHNGGEFIMTGGTISGNTNGSGGGVYVSGRFAMSGGIISGNTSTSAYYSGGGVYIDRGGIFLILGGTISENISATAGSGGGGVCIGGRGTFIMQGGTISGNTSGYGGGVCVDEGGAFTMQSGTISDNKSDRSGGGVYISGEYSDRGRGSFTMQGGMISGNTSRDSGGGVYVANYGTFTMQGGTISGNTSSGSGGGVNGLITKTGGTIYGSDEVDEKLRNTAVKGSALYNNNSSSGQWRNATAGPSVNSPATFGFWMND